VAALVMTELIPVDDETARIGVCWSCQQPFDGELYYVLVDTWTTCLGCACQLEVSENPPGRAA
jgi:hypothetical protein